MSLEIPKHSQTTLRFALIGMIVLAMLIPLAMVDGVTSERQSYFDATLNEVASAWGGAQRLSGPFLLVPETHRVDVQNQKGEAVTRRVTRERIYLPETLDLEVEVAHQIRSRAIYEVPVYTALARFRGRFPALETSSVAPDGVIRHLDQARLAVGISHTQAIGSASTVRFGADELAFEAGTGQPWIGAGIQAVLPAQRGGSGTDFTFELSIKGTRQLGFTPVGGTTHVGIASTWPHPSFTGRYLPERYEIGASGFSAEWNVYELARSLPADFLPAEGPGGESQLDTAWISLFQPVTDYTTVDRAIKYGLLFISMTFLGFICFELILALRFHPVQYGVIGAGLVLFYLALLSLSEHLDFGIAYLIATMLLTGLIGWYVWSMTASGRMTGWMAAIVAGLYGTLYVLLQLEAFALLVGTAVLFLGLAALMFSTRSLAVRAA